MSIENLPSDAVKFKTQWLLNVDFINKINEIVDVINKLEKMAETTSAKVSFDSFGEWKSSCNEIEFKKLLKQIAELKEENKKLREENDKLKQSQTHISNEELNSRLDGLMAQMNRWDVKGGAK